MGRYCTVCRRSDVSEIDRALLTGEPYRSIAALYGVSPTTLCRHKNHIPEGLAMAQRATEVARADDLLAQVEALRQRTMQILDRAEQADHRACTAQDADRARRTALKAIKEARGNLELLARLMGELQSGTQVNVLVSAEWVDLRTVILQAVEQYPEARRAIAEAISHVGR